MLHQAHACVPRPALAVVVAHNVFVVGVRVLCRKQWVLNLSVRESSDRWELSITHNSEWGPTTLQHRNAAACRHIDSTTHTHTHTHTQPYTDESLTCEVTLNQVLRLLSTESQQHVHLCDVTRVQADGVPRLCLHICKEYRNVYACVSNQHVDFCDVTRVQANRVPHLHLHICEVCESVVCV